MRADFTGELDLKFFTQPAFEPINDLDSVEQKPVIARNVLRLLMMGWTDSWTQIVTPDVAHAVLIQRNPEFLRELRFAFQQGFINLFEQLKDKEFNEAQSEQIQLYLSNCLSLLPYSDLTAYESIKVPQCIDKQWVLVEYQVTPIELTKVSGIARFFSWDNDRVFAYGFEPLVQKIAEPHLIFMGTTYPAGQGFLTQVVTDSKGFETVGHSLYRSGREKIQEWVSRQHSKVHVCGTSLGGSLALLFALDKGEQISRVDALNPAGLHDAWFKNLLDHWDELAAEDKPVVIVQKEFRDPVSCFGTWKKDWIIFKVVPPEGKQGPNGFVDHTLNYAGLKGTAFIAVNAELDNAKRAARNFWLYSLGRSLIYYSFLLPLTYIWRPSAHFIALALFNRKNAFNNDSSSSFAKMHDPSLPRNKIMDMYDLDNAMDIELTYKEVASYYQLIRCTLKQKEYLTSDDCESKHVKGVSKRTLLERSQNPEAKDEVVLFNVTKAKAAHIRHTLSLFDTYRDKSPEKLEACLKADYESYRLGK